MLPSAGFARGHVLMMANTPFPKLKVRIGNRTWKGKHFEEDGEFINQFSGFKALESKAVLGESWFDGQPCIIMEYPPKTPLFGNLRDEIRQIGPGFYLGRIHERCPCPKFRGYFTLTEQCTKH